MLQTDKRGVSLLPRLHFYADRTGCLLARFGLEIWNKGYDMNVLYGASYVFHLKQLNLVHYCTGKTIKEDHRLINTGAQ
jgi:hypothetical protein